MNTECLGPASVCGADSIRVALTGLGDCWGKGWGGGCGGEKDGRTDPRAPSVFGLGRPLVVAARSKACRRAAPWPICLLPLSAPLSLSFLLHPMLTTSSGPSPQQKLSSNTLLSESLSRSRPPNSDQPLPHPPGPSLWLRGN